MYKTIIIIPCYKVDKHIIQLLKKIDLKKIYKVILIDDACPNKTGLLVKKTIKKKNIKVITLKKNLGVGGATKYGIKEAIKFKPDHIIKMDGDGQHNPIHLKNFINIQKKNPDSYIKGFRSLHYKKIPFFRFIGNLIITFVIRLLTNNHNLYDVVNGFISIPKKMYSNFKFQRISNNYFFEQDMIFYTSLNKINIIQSKISTIYRPTIKSSLNEFKIIIPFILRYFYLMMIIIRKVNVFKF